MKGTDGHVSSPQRETFRRDGIVRVDDAVSRHQLEELRRDLRSWIEESRRHRGPLRPHRHDGVFIGAVSDGIARDCDTEAATFCGQAGADG